MGLIEAKPFESKYDEKDRFLYSCPSEKGSDIARIIEHLCLEFA